MIRTILIDLDDTLFDHHLATECAVRKVYESIPELSSVSFHRSLALYHRILEEGHLQIFTHRLSLQQSRMERFARWLYELSLSPDDLHDDNQSRKLAALSNDESFIETLLLMYHETYRENRVAVSGADEFLCGVKSAGLSVVVLSNNLREEQIPKLEALKLSRYVDHLVTPQEGIPPKPDPKIFEHAISQTSSNKDEAVMIGDSFLYDVCGAFRSGILSVWLRREFDKTPLPLPPEYEPARVRVWESFFPVHARIEELMSL